MRRLLLLILLTMPCLTLTFASGTTFTGVQNSDSDGNCGSGSSVCTTSVNASAAGQAIIIGVAYFDTTTQRTISSVTDNGASGGSTYTIVNSTAARDKNGLGTAMAFTCSAASGATTVTVTMSAAPGSGYKVFARVYSYTAGTCGKDFGGTNASSSLVNPLPGVTTTITGTSDVCVQISQIDNSSITSVSTYGNATLGNSSVADLINTANTTAPQWTGGRTNHGMAAALCLAAAVQGLATAQQSGLSHAQRVRRNPEILSSTWMRKLRQVRKALLNQNSLVSRLRKKGNPAWIDSRLSDFVTQVRVLVASAGGRRIFFGPANTCGLGLRRLSQNPHAD